MDILKDLTTNISNIPNISAVNCDIIPGPPPNSEPGLLVNCLLDSTYEQLRVGELLGDVRNLTLAVINVIHPVKRLSDKVKVVCVQHMIHGDEGVLVRAHSITIRSSLVFHNYDESSIRREILQTEFSRIEQVNELIELERSDRCNK